MQDEGDASGRRASPWEAASAVAAGRGSTGGLSVLLATLLGTPPAAGRGRTWPGFLTRGTLRRGPLGRVVQGIVRRVMAQSMKAYEAEGNKILELGVGLGPNIKYYANAAVSLLRQMQASHQINFTFVQGVAEALPVKDNSMDAVVGTLVLCSSPDVAPALKGEESSGSLVWYYIFIEHVAAQDGTLLRFAQRALDPLQQFVADGCHLARETGRAYPRQASLDVQISATSIDVLSIVSPHIYWTACKVIRGILSVSSNHYQRCIELLNPFARTKDLSWMSSCVLRVETVRLPCVTRLKYKSFKVKKKTVRLNGNQ
ncbi:unnamed protein product [Spirodela intermedia]|uniref:Methyltransferase type 11 domain-containing protein n=1 Tax=Spirodela intermedia TaxID=51605 RepID=A0A7I8IQ56_SPIIN|nr:unnamed protein product [Spirodela intermedia]CAA6659922.1 unnamed protein product [Spirodela intermedia]